MARGEGSTAEQLARRLMESRPHGVASAYLFGSHAAGRAHRESDVDVGVLLAWNAHPTARARFEVRLSLTADLQAALAAAPWTSSS